MCRNLWTLYALSLGLSALVCLAVANEVLRRVDAQHSAARKRLREDVTRELRRRQIADACGQAETQWLIADSARRGLVVERDYGAMSYLPERN